MNISLSGQSVPVTLPATCGEVIRGVLSGKQLKKTVAVRCDTVLLDLGASVPSECTAMEPVFTDSAEGLEIIRHSAAHVMAQAVRELFAGVRITIGPAIENGFYYDFDYERAFTPEDLEAIEQEMQRIIASDVPFTRTEKSRQDLESFFAQQGETYKSEIMDSLGEEHFSVYTQGNFTDLCRGPHIPSTRFIRAFKLTSVAGAYWRGDENNTMLQRIYGTAFADEKALKKYLNQLEEAKKRDHRKLGPQLDLFSFHEQGGAGMAYWHPKGALLRTILEDFVHHEMLIRGYDIVRTPQLFKRELWERSGHYENYRENMYFTEIDDVPYGVKPMNCVGHILVYNTGIKSYRDLPKRYFEFGVVHRHEKSGVLHGLLRVRQFTQDDAHIICAPEQLQEEIQEIMRWNQDFMGLFGFELFIELSTRPEKSIGTDEDWARATDALENAMQAMHLAYEINEGDGAFYGPKIDIKVRDCLGRYWQCSTIQVDFTLPERFDMVYINAQGKRCRPAMIHRTAMGSVERFIGVLTEQYGGAFPVWLCPVQARILTVTDAHREFAQETMTFLKKQGIRIEADLRNEKLGFKVREAQMEKIPYLLVVGDKEVADRGVSVRLRGEDKGMKSLEEVATMVRVHSHEPFKRGGMSYSFASHPYPV